MKCHPQRKTKLLFAQRNRSPRSGFTLLEVILAMSIIAMLVGSVFSITNSSVLLSQSVIENQSSHRHKVALESYLENLLMNLPTNVTTHMTEDEDGLQKLTINNPGTYFPSSQNDHLANFLEFTTLKNRDGLLQLTASLKVTSPSSPEEPLHEENFTLISDLTSIKWTAYSEERIWYPTLRKTSRVTHMRITYTTSSQEEPQIKTFWIPPRVINRN